MYNFINKIKQLVFITKNERKCIIYVDFNVSMTIDVIDIDRKISITEKLSIINPTEVDMINFWRSTMYKIDIKLSNAKNIVSTQRLRRALEIISNDNRIIIEGKNFDIIYNK